MDHPIARPARTTPADPALAAVQSATGASSFSVPAYSAKASCHLSKAPASPQHKRKPRPGWKATIVRSESFAELRRIQKSTRDPVIDLSYLADACVELALELGAERIVQRAIASFGSVRPTP